MMQMSSSIASSASQLLDKEILIAGSAQPNDGARSPLISASAAQCFAEEVLMMPFTDWPSGFSCGVSAMDKLHRDFLNAMEELSLTKDQEFSSRYSALVSTVESVFRQEDQWMEELDFPVLRVHQEQHARVLGALHNVHSHVMEGDVSLGREVVKELLPQWLSFHLSTMDAVLAVTMQMAQGETAKSKQTDSLEALPLTS